MIDDKQLEIVRTNKFYDIQFCPEYVTEFYAERQRLLLPIVTDYQMTLLAVLVRTIYDAKNGIREDEPYYSTIEAKSWFFETEKFHGCHSFDEVCNGLSNYPEELKRRIREFIRSPRLMLHSVAYFFGESSLTSGYAKRKLQTMLNNEP